MQVQGECIQSIATDIGSVFWYICERVSNHVECHQVREECDRFRSGALRVEKARDDLYRVWRDTIVIFG